MTDQIAAVSPEDRHEVLRVLIADDHPLMATALATYIDSDPRMRAVATAQDGEQALNLARQYRPDVVVMDLQMPVMNGVTAIATIREELPAIAILAVTTFSTESFVLAALRAGAAGYIVKDAQPADILTAIRNVHEGMAPLSPDIAHRLQVSVLNDVARLGTALKKKPEPPHIPDRELESLTLLARGFSNAEIAAHMMVSEATVKVYMTRNMQRLHVRDRVQLLIRASAMGLVQPSLP